MGVKKTHKKSGYNVFVGAKGVPPFEPILCIGLFIEVQKGRSPLECFEEKSRERERHKDILLKGRRHRDRLL